VNRVVILAVALPWLIANTGCQSKEKQPPVETMKDLKYTRLTRLLGLDKRVLP